MKTVALEPTKLDLGSYMEVVPTWVGHELRCLGRSFSGATVVHVNSTASGGGVAEILRRLVPLQRGLGLDAHWLVMDGDEAFYGLTKKLHNSLQGQRSSIQESEWEHYLEVNRENRRAAGEILDRADFVIIHDPQPAPLLKLGGKVRGHWAWRCHIDLSRPQRAVWRRLHGWVEPYAASIFSLASFSRRLRHTQVLIAPAIDPLTDKNRDLPEEQVDRVCESLGVPRDQPLFVQISRFDRFKDPLGVIHAFQILRRHRDAHLVLAGGGADDDPEGTEVLDEVREAVEGDDRIHILLLPGDANVEVNALERAATVIVQKSVREGFGLVVTEGLWKEKAVIGGAVGGIVLQVFDEVTGYLVHTVEGCAHRMRCCLRHPTLTREMGANGRERVRGQFLITRQLRDYFMLLALLEGHAEPAVGPLPKI